MNDVVEQLSKIGIVPVVKLDDENKAVKLADALIKGGLPCAEVTFRTEAAAESIKLMLEAHPDMIVGAGTVITKEQVDKAAQAGSKFIVSPGYVDEVVEYCNQIGMPVVPGISNASEAAKAVNAGLKTVKFFPAEQNGGLNAIKALAAPYHTLKFMPTGGINQNNIKEYLSFEKIICCGGSWMVKDNLINENRFDEIEKMTREAVDLILGFGLAHIGINCENDEKAGEVADSFDNIFGFEKKENPSSIFAGSVMEAMRTPYLGTNGHIAIGTDNIERAIYHLERRGVKFNMESAKFRPDGSMVAIYIDNDFGGFAVHLVER